MVKFYLKVKADLTNVTDLQPLNNPQSPHEFQFNIECTNCREVHDKPVTINTFEKHEISGSRGEASFVFRCKACKSEHSAQIERTKEKLAELGNWCKILEIDARGVEFVEFKATGQWTVNSTVSSAKFDEVDLEDAEWYDYDDNAGEEVSVTEVEFDIARS